MREAEDDAVLDAVLGGVLGDARARRGERHEVTPHVPFDAEREIDERLPAAAPGSAARARGHAARAAFGFVTGDSLDVTAVDFRQPVPASRGELMAVFDASLAATRLYLAALDDARATEAWTLRAGETSWSRLRAPG